MDSAYSFDLNKTGILRSPVELRCGTLIIPLEENKVTVDYGAGTCHISYSLWRDSGLHELCFNEKKDFLKAVGIESIHKLTFKTLPLVPTMTRLGNGTEVPAYPFRVDKLTLGNPLNGITLENITVRVLQSAESEFFIGLNVLRYLSVEYTPSIFHSIFNLSLKNDGLAYLEHDRFARKINNLTSIFHSMQDIRE